MLKIIFFRKNNKNACENEIIVLSLHHQTYKTKSYGRKEVQTDRRVYWF